MRVSVEGMTERRAADSQLEADNSRRLFSSWTCGFKLFLKFLHLAHAHNSKWKQHGDTTIFYNRKPACFKRFTCTAHLWAEGSANWGWSLNRDTFTQTCCKEDTIYCLRCHASADTKPGKAAAAFWVDETPHWPNRAPETSAENRRKIKSSNKYCRRLGNHALIISHYAAIMAPFISKWAHLKEENAHELIKIIH